MTPGPTACSKLLSSGPARAHLRDHRLAVPAVQHAVPAPGPEPVALAAAGCRRDATHDARSLRLALDRPPCRRADRCLDDAVTRPADSGTWSDELCRELDLPRAILPELIEPGSELGPLRSSVAEEVGLTRPVTVIAPATHDTASAVAAVPVKTSTLISPVPPPDWCYLSSGTWSLLGVEVPRPVINAETMRYNFTNEGGVAGTTRLLKNIMGLWLVQECRRTWARTGRELSYEEMIARAQVAPPFTTLVDPDDASFLAPGDMPARLAALLHPDRTGAPRRRGGHGPLLPGKPGTQVSLDRSTGSNRSWARRSRRSTWSAAGPRTPCFASSPPMPAAGPCMPDQSRPRRLAIS